jgi:hypothetical protein
MNKRSSMKMLDWNGYEMEVAESRDRVQAACYHHRNLIQSACAVLEPAEVIQKLVRSRHARDFGWEERKKLKQGLGYYCDLQSLHSEDAITWSVFGTVAHCEEAIRVRWTRELFSALGLKSQTPEHSEITLWRRVPHPEVLTDKGPEIDFSVITEDTILLAENKWTAKIDRHQGRNRDKDQIEMRLEFLKRYGQTISYLNRESQKPEFKNQVVLLVTIDPHPIEDKWLQEGIEMRSTTWEQVCSLESHPFADEVGRYYRWKLEHMRREPLHQQREEIR